MGCPGLGGAAVEKVQVGVSSTGRAELGSPWQVLGFWIGRPLRKTSPGQPVDENLGSTAPTAGYARAAMNKRFWLVIGTVLGGVFAFTIAWMLASGDIDKAGDWRNGAARFVGSVTAIGLLVGYIVARQLAGATPHARGGFTLQFGRIEAKPEGYREMAMARVGQLLGALRAVGYEPTTERCDDTGAAIGGDVDTETPLAGANFAIRDRGVKGHVRLQLAQPLGEQRRSIGVLETWSRGGESTEELGLFTLRALSTLVDNVTAARESSQLSGDPAELVTAGLADRPVHRKA